MKKLIQSYVSFSPALRDMILVLIRCAMAYGLYAPAVMKWGNIDGIASWFDSMGIPAPTLNAYLAATVEMAGVILLPLGLFTRVISALLVFVMLVAIFTVHISHGWKAGDNGVEIPVYYMLFFLLMHFNGAGKWSVDHFIFKNKTA